MKKKYKTYFIPSARERICDALEGDKKHHLLVKQCAKSFAQTDLSQRSGYEFYFTEPLIEFGAEKKGNHNFDLFLYNEGENRAIFVECKSSITDVKRALREVGLSRDLVLEKTDYLSGILEIDLDPNRFEYVLCINEKDKMKVIDSMKAQDQKPHPKYDINRIKIWIYAPRSQLIQLPLGCLHENSALNEMLHAGFGDQNLHRQYELPYCYSTNPYRLIHLAVIGECYRKNLFDDGVEDPKVIEKSMILSTLMTNISLGVPDELKIQLVAEKLQNVLEYGQKYQLFDEVDADAIRLNCRGTKLRAVLENIEEKFITRWVDEKTSAEGEKLALKDYWQSAMRNQSTLSQFPERKDTSIEGENLDS